ncbi:hypothetical protein GXW78_23050 [Roseomonas terrae]|uniref:Uncharacterized protein n=1 Tax=Neoroseomonas terrae TaxID=424799 RepID=A0ABS5ENG2_9PROT|nr:hypothetical protein [Neoroseomonas terrae]MBR0652553.1 hypothetical protein [Neoroseomonas terrae]
MTQIPDAPEEELRREAERQQGGTVGDVLDATGTVLDLGITAVEIVASSAGQAAIGAASAAVEGTVTVATVSLEVVGSVLGGLTDL